MAADHHRPPRALVPILTAFDRRRMPRGDEIEDLVQETLIAIHTRRASYDRDRAFTAWLFAIARYKMIDHFRRRRREASDRRARGNACRQGFEAVSNAQARRRRSAGDVAWTSRPA